MPKIAACSLGFRGHVNPLLSIVEGLAAKGHQVTYHCIEAYRTEIEGQGAAFRPYRSMFEGDFAFPANDAAFSLFLVTVLEAQKVLPQVLDAARQDPPDLVLYDGACLSGRLLGQLLGCPTVKLCPSYASTEDYSPFEEGRRDFFASSEKVAAFEAATAELNATFGVDYDLGNHAEGLNIVRMPRHFHPNPEAFDERFAFVGPSLRDEPDLELTWDDPERPLLFISLGTLNNDKPGFYQRCFEAFGDSQWNVLMPVGTRVSREGWQVPQNFRVEAFVPQLRVLEQARCFVTQGGMNSVQEALAHAVPLVVLPSTGEQALTARQVQELGLGAGLEVEAPPAEEMRAHVDRVANDAELRARVEDFAEVSRQAGGHQEAVRRIEAYLGADGR